MVPERHFCCYRYPGRTTPHSTSQRRYVPLLSSNSPHVHIHVHFYQPSSRFLTAKGPQPSSRNTVPSSPHEVFSAATSRPNSATERTSVNSQPPQPTSLKAGNSKSTHPLSRAASGGSAHSARPQLTASSKPNSSLEGGTLDLTSFSCSCDL